MISVIILTVAISSCDFNVIESQLQPDHVHLLLTQHDIFMTKGLQTQRRSMDIQLLIWLERHPLQW